MRERKRERETERGFNEISVERNSEEKSSDGTTFPFRVTFLRDNSNYWRKLERLLRR